MLKPKEKAPYISSEAFAVLYENTHRIVFRYVYGLLGGEQAEAEDITAETFLKAWDARQRFFGTEEQVLSWLFTIAKRSCIDHWRKSRIQVIDVETVLLAAADASPEEKALIHEQSSILLKLLGSLDEEKREILVLRYLLAWSVNQIADYLNKSPNTISQTLRRSLQSLREAWPDSD